MMPFMAEYVAYPLDLPGDDPGAPRLHGEIVVARTWSSDLDDPGDGNDFRIVVLTVRKRVAVAHAAVAVLAPGDLERRGRLVAEPSAVYSLGGPTANAAPIDLDPALTSALSRGRLLTPIADPPPLSLFEDGPAAWQALAAALTRAGRAQPAWRAVSVALGVAPGDCKRALAKLIATAERSLDDGAASDLESDLRGAAGRLSALAAGSTNPRPLDVADDVYCLRVWLTHREETAELLRMRAFLGEAEAGDGAGALAGLALDRAIAREQLSFAALLAEPHRLAAMQSTFDYFRRRYRAAYERRHRSYHETAGRLAREVHAAFAQARALCLLNRITGLGPPLGRRALALPQLLPAGAADH